jgi:hypothetical protein
MSDLLRLAVEQAVGVFVGIVSIFVIQPETTGGELFIIFVSIVIINVIIQIARLVLKLFKKSEAQQAVQPKEDWD